MAAEAARVKKETGELKLWAALAIAYPTLAAFLARHPTLGRFVNKAVRVLGSLAWRMSARWR
jgi:hypothetical protein